MTWSLACLLDDFPQGTKKVVVLDGVEILLIHEDRIYAIENLCSHEDEPLEGGCIRENTLECPRHGWFFDFRTGACHTSSDFDLPTYPTRIQDGEIWVEIPAWK